MVHSPACSDTGSDDDSYESLILRARNSDTSSDASSEEADTLCEELANWAVETKATASSCDKLLRILHKRRPDLPMTYRTLVKDGQAEYDRPNPNIIEVSEGQYLHLGILSGLKLYQSDIVKKGVLCIQYQVNTDGLPLWSSSSTHLWPILGRVLDMPDVFPIGVF